MQTEHLTFYHGTGAAAANTILNCGARNSLFEDIGARELGQEIRRALLDCTGFASNEDWRFHSLSGPGIETSGLWVLVLQQLEHPEDSSLIEYGHFFATLNIANAYRYSRNPYRSEFILALAESLKFLDHLGHSLPQSVATRFPEVARLIDFPSSPVVLELSGICSERLSSERGGDEIEATLEEFQLMQQFQGVNAPASLRIRAVSSADVVAVHDLSGWNLEEIHDGLWRPDPSRVSEVRHSVRDWLAKGV